jgi:hypothetical protein
LEEGRNCSVWNMSESVDELSSSFYDLDHDLYLGELILVTSLCIPASLAVIIYILRFVLYHIYYLLVPGFF